MEEKAFTRRKEVRRLPGRGTLAWHLLLSMGCCEFGYRAQRKRWELFLLGMKAAWQSWASGAAGCVCRAFLWCCPGYLGILYPISCFLSFVFPANSMHQGLTCCILFLCCFIWPTEGVLKYPIGCQHLNTGKFCVKTWISSFC